MNRSEFKPFIESHQKIIFRICWAYSNSQEEYDDYFQEVCLQLWKARNNFNNRSQLSTWVYKVTLNVCLSELRKRKRLVKTHPIESTDVIDHQDDSQHEEAIKNLYQAIRKLKEGERAIILLYLEDKSYKEMADILGISLSNIGVKINRIKSTLKELMNGR